MKEVMKEEERKNFEKLIGDKKKTTVTSASPTKTLSIKKSKKQLEPPKSPKSAGSVYRQKKVKQNKKYVFAPENIQKLPKETQKDFKMRYGFTVMAIPQQKELLDPVEQHRITKE